MAAAVAVIAITAICAKLGRWKLRLIGVPSMHALPVDPSGFELERLPLHFVVSFARGGSVYLISVTGDLLRLDDGTPPETAVKLGRSPIPSPRMLHVTARGTVLVSGEHQPLYRSVDSGRTWTQVHDWSFWRADEDEAGGTVYAGNYSDVNHPVYCACLFRSRDDGQTWDELFRDEATDHIHSVRYDPPRRRLLLCVGDGDHRGEVASDDGGRNWSWARRGRGHGDTDVAVTPDFAVWGSDDHRGRIYRTPHSDLRDAEQMIQGRGHQVWWLVADHSALFAATFCEHGGSPTAAHVLASRDQGAHWQNVLELRNTEGGTDAYGFQAESRRSTTAGWVYFASTDHQGYRVRSSGR